MRLLLDTHVWVWSQESSERFGPDTLAAFSSLENPLFVSTISTVEIARLLSLDRLRLTVDLSLWIRESLSSLGAETIEVSHEIAIEAYRLPPSFQRDPADRLLAGTARIHGLRLVTADQELLARPELDTLDART